MCPRDARHARELSEYFSADPANNPDVPASSGASANLHPTSYANPSYPEYANTSSAYANTSSAYANTSSAYANAANPNDYISSNGNGEALTDIQNAIDFSDLGITAEQRTNMAESEELGQHAVSVNQRYDAAKRKVAEYKLKPGVYDHKQRRRLVEALLRRPACGRRVRSWRTENSDTLRGDAVPKTVSSWGLMRMGGSNPAIDLHPGALGTLSGMSGKWLSEDNTPENAIDDLYM
jgi:hypothetical protein